MAMATPEAGTHRKGGMVMKIRKIILAVTLFAIVLVGSICFSGKDNVVQAVDSTMVEKVMNVKCQVTADTDENTTTPVNMRLVSSVDCLENYKEVGFEVYYNGATTAVPIRTSTVYERIEASADSGIEYNYSPKVISTDSEYFFTATLLNIHPNNFNNTFHIKPYCITTDGQTLYGVSRYVKVSDYYNNMINIPVKATEAQTTGMTVDYNTTKLTQVEGYAHDGAYAHLKFQVNDGQTLSSLTSFVVKDSAGNTVDTTTYRNLTTEYTGDGVGDTSWYTEALAADSTETEFIIATNADLYGLASMTKADTTLTFADKTIYMVADIAFNDEILVTDSTDTAHYKKWYTVNDTTGEKTYKDAPDYTWLPIAGSGFYGHFDGQMHTISGIYFNGTSGNTGLFGCLKGNSSVKNLKLVNSYLKSTNIRTGSIAGRVDGTTISSVYSDAIVESSNKWVGGFLGMAYNAAITMNDCWYAGTVRTTVTTTKLQGTAGFIGDVNGTCNITIDNCLNTGIVDATSYAYGTTICPCAGGFLGYVEGSSTAYATVNIKNSLSVGPILINESASAAIGYGPVIGYRGAGAVTISNVAYAMEDTYNSVSLSNIAVANFKNCTQLTSINDLVGKSVTDVYGFASDELWTTSSNFIPLLTSFKNEVADTSWFDEDKDTFVLYNKADLFGFAALSQTENFAGKTVKLGADIVVNTGDSSTWGTTAPQIEWTPIGSKNLPFAGTFDGGMYTISGLYMNTTKANSGLFSVTGDKSIVKNLELTNSYFTSTTNGLGSIAGQGRGRLDTVKSDIYVIGCTTQTGGLIGLAYGTNVDLAYCWYNGTVTNTGTAAGHRGTGGLIGVIFTNGKTIMTDCLNSGLVDATTSTQYIPKVGGLVGNVESGAEFIPTHCVNVGTISVASGKIGGVIAGCIDGGAVVSNYSYGYGSNCIVGYMQNGGTFNVNYILEGTKGTANRTVNGNYLGDVPVINSKRTFTGLEAATSLEGLDFENTWTAVEGSTPVLNFGGEIETVDTRWYNADAEEYVLYDMGDLYGFAQLSKTNTFAGKTVKLGRDIIVNEGSAKYWGTKAPKYVWPGTGTFAGTFDGQGYTISGIYMSATAIRQGFFGITDTASVIKNFKLTNSYFTSTTWGLGSVAGQGRGQFINIYSDATVTCPGQFLGGIVGMGYGSNLVMKNCWFAGTVINTGDGGTGVRGTGGILGCVFDAGSAQIINCLNEGIVNAKAYTYDQNTGKTDAEANPLAPNVTTIVGGIVGYIKVNATVEITGCLNVGEIQYSDVATGGYNPLVGYNTAGTTLTVSACYATKESCEAIDLSNISSDSVTQVDAVAIKGDAAKDAMKLLDWDTAWECRTNKSPIVVFSEKVSEGTDYTATEEDKALLTGIYGNYTLYQGELHNHADNGGTSDGTKPLSDWKTQMEENDLDFAASLDHRQTWHINHDDWDKNLFIYGTEAATTISDYAGETGNGELHYNMIFAEQAQLKNVVMNFNNGAFDYNSMLDNKWSSLLSPAFNYPEFTKAKFNELIDTVKAQDGLFILAHPMQQGSAYFSDNASDYAFVRDYIGFEVIYTQLSCGNTRTNYKAWKELLAAGKRLWACSGSDSHADLDSKTLTSVYADSTDKAAGNLVTYMKNGNFTAGSVGIQMCVGNTPMGGHCDFTNQRVVIDVGEFHTSIDVSHKYRIDIMNENGIVYSQALNVDETTRIATNGKIAFDADESDFYRVVIYDMTDGYRIAYGNPIWNDK